MKTCFSLICLLFGFGFLASGQEPGDVIWEFQIGGWVESSPAIGSDGTIYIGAGEKRKVYALNGKTGAIIWEFAAGQSVDSTPAIGSDGTVYIGSGEWSGDGKVFALDGVTGDKIWEFIVGGYVESSPAIGSDGTVYIGAGDGKVYALNGKSGVKKWAFNTGNEIESSPAIGSDGTVYIGSADGKVYAIKPNGTKKWASNAGEEVGSSPAIGSDGTVYIGGSDGVYALDGKRGTRKWKFNVGSYWESSPAIGSDGTIYIGSGDHESGNGKVYALNGKSGVKKWEFEVEGSVESCAAIGNDGTVYIGSGGGKVYALDGKSGAKKWELKTDWVESSPAIGSDGTVYIGGGKVYAIKSSSSGPANSPWPMFSQNNQRTGRKMPTPAPAPPVITTHPIPQTVDAGASVTFSVAATGTAPLSYRWFKNNVHLGFGSNELVLTNVKQSDTGSYKVVVSNDAGQVTSSSVQLTVKSKIKSDLTYSVLGNTVTITDCKKSATGDLVIPSTYDGKPVTSIGNNAFAGCSSLTSVTIPDSVTSIGGGAFNGCSSLTSVTIPDSVTSIEDSTFRRCSSLTSVTIPDSVTNIKQVAFYGCSSLTSVTIGNNVTFIDILAFWDCSSLTSITFKGNAPSLSSQEGGVFVGVSENAKIFVNPGATGFGESLQGLPVVILGKTKITLQPKNQIVELGDSAEFVVGASGIEPLEYQWYKDGQQIAGATETIYRIVSVSQGDLGIYSVWAQNKLGRAYSQTVELSLAQLHTLTVASRDPDSGITVTVSPADQNGQAGGTTQFTRVYFKGTEVTLTAAQSVGANQFKQWLGNGVPVGTEPTVTVTMDYDRTLRAVYELESMPSSAYQIIEGNFSWHEAKADAEERGGHLATITSEEESRLLDTLTESHLKNGEADFWIGGTDSRKEGVWEWITGESWLFDNWGTGEPNNLSGIENHAAYNARIRNGDFWIDQVGARDGPRYGYILEIPKVNLERGLVAYYPFNGNANDESGNGNDAILTSNIDFQKHLSVPYNSAYFNGDNSVIKLPPLFKGKKVSFSIWYYMDSATYGQGGRGPTLFSQGAVVAQRWSTFGLAMWRPEDLVPRYTLESANPSNRNPDTLMAFDNLPEIKKWTHVAGSFDGGRAEIYVNGVLENSDQFSHNFIEVGVTDLFMGTRGDNMSDWNFHGNLSNFRIYDRAITEAEVSELYELGNPPPFNPEEGLVAYYPFNGNANDESGNENDLESISGNLSFVEDRFGKSQSTGYINKTKLSPINTRGFPEGNSDFTISIWMNLHTGGSEDGSVMIFSNEIRGGFEFGLYNIINQNPIPEFWLNGPAVFGYPTNQERISFPFDSWHQLVLRRKNDSISLCINNKKIAEGKNNNPIAGSGFIIGGRLTPQHHLWTGNLDDIRIYNRALSEVEVAALYELERTPLPSRFTFETPKMNSDGNLILKAKGPANSNVTYQFTYDLINWHDQFTLPMTNGESTITLPVPITSQDSQLFYRLKLVE